MQTYQLFDLNRRKLTGQNFWVKEHRQVYLIGNPAVWWTSSFGILAYLACRGILILRQQRGFRDLYKRNQLLIVLLC